MEYLFEENQKFKQWWLWVILLFYPILSIIPFDENGINYYAFLITVAFPLLVYVFQLRVKINEEGLHYQFYPFHFKSHIIKLHEIEKFEALQYRPIGDYGGWGIRHGFKGKAYNISGNKGVKIYLKNGKNILFGSQKYKELEKALKKIMKQ